MAATTVRYRFSGHQTFPLRYPWLPKAIRLLQHDPEAFFREDAMVTLGVGKNMVSSIRYWTEALRLGVVDGRTKSGSATRLGEALFADKGWDPYLEAPGTLWLLHWQLVHSPDQAATWYLAFNKWNRDVFTRNELLDWLVDVVDRLEDKRTSKNSLKRDIDVFVRTYVPADPDGRRSLEDTFDCPLVELGLIREIEGGLYQFNRGPKLTLPLEVFTYALLKYWREYGEEQATLNFERVLYEPGSPGCAFKLSEAALAQLLVTLPEWSDLKYDETAGLRLLIRKDTKRLLEPIECLRRYYEDRLAREAA